MERAHRIRVIAVRLGDEAPRIGPGSLARDIGIQAGAVLGVLGAPAAVEAFAQAHGLTLSEGLEVFAEALSPQNAGIAELVIPPKSALIG